jgi:two-component system, NtrC family, response regulator AtoC
VTRSQLYLLVVGDGVLATTALPAGSGVATLGRAPGCDVQIDDETVSANHATLHLGDPLTIVDHGSANGTWVHDQRIESGVPVEIDIDQAVRVGAVTIIVQRQPQRLRPRRKRTHSYFEDRLEDECARARRHDANFAVVHVLFEDPSVEAHDLLVSTLREGDVIAAYAPGEYEIILIDTVPDQAAGAIRRIEAALANRNHPAHVGSAWYPRDGREPSDLSSRARSRATGVVQESPIDRGIVVADQRMTALHQLVARVAAADISVLLQGETGVGKEVIAESIHRQSTRATKPFLRLNCAALTETLLESELFGHEKGAFTGAIQAKVGLLEVAEGGVVFLDEVGELLPSTQAKLLRVLDERKVLRVGSVTPRPIDVRIVSATNRDLDAEVQRGAFRLDLMYRLNAMSIIIPPLRERRGEIVPLIHRFLFDIAVKNGQPVPRITDAALALLSSYSWPGNVRELRNVMERAMVLVTDDIIDLDSLPVDRLQATFGSAPSRPSGEFAIPRLRPMTPPPGEQIDERQAILDALEACAGNQTNAAKLLGISRRTLINKIEKFAVPRPRKR